MVRGCTSAIAALRVLLLGRFFAAASQNLRVQADPDAPAHLVQPALRAALAHHTYTNLSALPSYHSSDVIRDELWRLASPGACPGAHFTLHTEEEAGASLEVVTLSPRAARNASGSEQRVFLLFGEHARELISPELGFFFLRLLCADPGLQIDGELKRQAATLLAGRDRVEYLVVVNANPVSRRRVEAGEWCLRVNERGVDLNRNWGAHRDAVPESQRADPDQYEGPEAFSEPETRIVRRLVERFRPMTFVSVHSGTFMLGTPAAYTAMFPSIPMPNGMAMLDVIKPINEKYCQCASGPVGIAVGYESAGTCLDFVYENEGVPFAFIWEIYTNGAPAMHSAWRESSSWLDDPETRQRWAGTPVSLDNLARESSLVQMSAHHAPSMPVLGDAQRNKTMAAQQRSMMKPEECLRMFNPMTTEDYRGTLRSWSAALLELSVSINAYLPGNPKALSVQSARMAADAQRQALQEPLRLEKAAIHNRYADLYKKLGLKHHR